LNPGGISGGLHECELVELPAHVAPTECKRDVAVLSESRIEDGRICLTNNAAERALRGIAFGRKSWLFAGSAAASALL
jgi:hypothetical protein